MVQALIERELRQAMKRQSIEELPIYPEQRQCRRPTTEQILRLFSLAERLRHHLPAHKIAAEIRPELCPRCAECKTYGQVSALVEHLFDLAAHQAMNPVFSDREGVGEQRHVALVVASTQIDQSGFSSSGRFDAVSGDVTSGDGHQACEVGAMVALPDFFLPEGVEAFDGVL
ncbi:MAG: hypothetical protein ACREBC_00155, partial [Pyrinomonadaceae bacterium]